MKIYIQWVFTIYIGYKLIGRFCPPGKNEWGEFVQKDLCLGRFSPFHIVNKHYVIY